MLDLHTYGLKIHYNTTSRGHVEWTGHEEVLYKSLQFNMAQFNMAQFCSMIHGLVTESRRLSVGKHAHEIPGIPWQSLRDDPTDEQLGWNLLHNHRSRILVDGQ
ncbi:hypothetical protein LTR28_004245, partial [Elasticomyces elasticus]